MSLIYSKLKDGVLTVKIEILYRGTYPVLAGYVYQLKADNLNMPIEQRLGDNINNQDDIYYLPTPVRDNVGRKVVLSSQVSALDHDSDFEVIMNVIQDGQVTDSTKSTGKVLVKKDAAITLDVIIFT